MEAWQGCWVFGKSRINALPLWRAHQMDGGVRREDLLNTRFTPSLMDKALHTTAELNSPALKEHLTIPSAVKPPDTHTKKTSPKMNVFHFSPQNSFFKFVKYNSVMAENGICNARKC